MTVMLVLSCIAASLALAPIAVALGRTPAATPIVYGASLASRSSRCSPASDTCSADRRPPA